MQVQPPYIYASATPISPSIHEIDRVMEFRPCFESSSASKGKEREEDLLGMLGSGGVVDCCLRLGPPGSGDHASNATRWQLMHPPPQASAASNQSASVISEVCTMCAATETPLWRRGPCGPKSLCNACGIRYKKEERRLSLSLGTPSYQTKAPRDQRKNCDVSKG